MDSDPTEEDAPVCAECHLAYDRNANTGQWACRMHPSPARTMHTATLCCGVVAAEVNGMCDALHNPDRASRWEAKEHAETDKAGCVRVDHRPPDADRLRWLGAVSVMVPVGAPPRTDALILKRDVNMATLDAGPWKVTVPLAWSAAGAPPGGAPTTQEWDVTELARHALRQVYAQPLFYTRRDVWPDGPADLMAQVRASKRVQQRAQTGRARHTFDTLFHMDGDASDEVTHEEVGAFLERYKDGRGPLVQLWVVRRAAPAQEAAILYRHLLRNH